MKVEIRLRDDINGVELRFDKKPPQEVLTEMGRNGLGFSWHYKGKYWFAKQTPERLAFARRLAGIEEERAQKPENETYRYFSTQRPVDLGTYPKAGGAMIGFENFDERMTLEDEGCRAWGWLDYSRPLTEKEQDDYELRPAKDTLRKLGLLKDDKTEFFAEAEKSNEGDSTVTNVPNIFAAHYDSIGDIKIVEHAADVNIIDLRAAYIKDLNLYVHKTGCGDCLSVLSLDGAGKTGKVCQDWKFSIKSWPNERIDTKLYNDYGMHTIKDVWDKCLGDQGKRVDFMLDTDEIHLSNYQRKGVDIFTPFVEVKPLKAMPEKWTKKNFAQALLSGQIFRGEVQHYYTDDYALDAANGFGAGNQLNMAKFAQEAIEGWGKGTDVRRGSDTPDKSGVWTLSYSEHSNSSMTLWFDINCDIAESKRRQEAHKAGVRQFNAMLRASCIQPDLNAIDPTRIYTIQSLEMTNSGVLQAVEENVQGYVLRSNVQEGYSKDILSINELEIHPEQLFQVSNSFNRPRENLSTDDRVISCGNWQCFVTGKALLELTAEGVRFPILQKAEGEYGTPEKFKATLEKFIRGTSWFACSNKSPASYQTALDHLEAEVDRAHNQPAPALDSMLRSINARSGEHTASQRKSKVVEFPSRS